MGTIERIFHAVLFEVLAVSLSICGLAFFTDHKVTSLSVTMIVIATIAMIWNLIFNYVFDRYATGDREKRSVRLRVLHVVLFEIGLLLFTIPAMAWILDLSLWEAFIMDVGVTIFITIYAFVFNYSYDHLRAYLVQGRAKAMT
ncbi:PACE efflux transporter [Vibrio astriarenae]